MKKEIILFGLGIVALVAVLNFSGCAQNQYGVTSGQAGGAIVGAILGDKIGGYKKGPGRAASVIGGGIIGSIFGKKLEGNSGGVNRNSGNYNTMSTPSQCQEYVDNPGALRNCTKGVNRSNAEQQRVIEQEAYKKGYSGGGNRY